MSETDPLLPVPAVSSRPIPILSNLVTTLLHMALTVVWVVVAFFRRVASPVIHANDLKTVANYRLLIDELTEGALIVSNAYYIVNALKIKDDNDLKFTIIATAGVSLLFQVAIAIFFFVDHVSRLSRKCKQ